MPNKPTKKMGRTRLPPGHKRDDFEPEVLVEFDRERDRTYKHMHRRKQRRLGIRDVTFSLGQDARDKLERLCRMHGQSKAKVLTRLIMEVPDVPENR